MAARLHALTLPILAAGASTAGSFVFTNPAPIPPTSGKDAPSTRPEGAVVSAPATTLAGATAQNANDKLTYWPVPCVLDVMLAQWGGTEYGIRCLGFVEEAKVIFHGPWLQGSASGSSMDGLRNIPSSVDYEFTFVHQPGYTNKFQGSQNGDDSGTSLMLQAMASDVYQRLYSQADLGVLSTKPTFKLNVC